MVDELNMTAHQGPEGIKEKVGRNGTDGVGWSCLCKVSERKRPAIPIPVSLSRSARFANATETASKTLIPILGSVFDDGPFLRARLRFV